MIYCLSTTEKSCLFYVLEDTEQNKRWAEIMLLKVHLSQSRVDGPQTVLSYLNKEKGWRTTLYVNTMIYKNNYYSDFI
jgi:hypothetical protein